MIAVALVAAVLAFAMFSEKSWAVIKGGGALTTWPVDVFAKMADAGVRGAIYVRKKSGGAARRGAVAVVVDRVIEPDRAVVKTVTAPESWMPKVGTAIEITRAELVSQERTPS